MQNSIKEEVYKCSKCGLCQSVCPIFLAQKNEMFLPRGRFIVLNNYFNNNIPLNKQFIKNLDICLNCNACKRFCPSNLDSYKIFTKIKSGNKIGTFFYYYKFLLHIYSIFKPFKIQTVKRNKTINKSSEKVVFFEGCYNKYINSSDRNASLNLIEQNGGNTAKIISNCCGYPLLSDGNINKFKKNAEKIINSIPFDCKYIICSCDTCYDTLLKCFELADNTKKYLEKLITLDKYLELKNFDLPKTENILYHKPLLRAENTYLPDCIKIINKKGSATLMENFFMIKHKKEYNKILNKVFYKKKDIQNKTIVTTCNISKLGLYSSAKKLKINCRILSYYEFLNNYFIK